MMAVGELTSAHRKVAEGRSRERKTLSRQGTKQLDEAGSPVIQSSETRSLLLLLLLRFTIIHNLATS